MDPSGIVIRLQRLKYVVHALAAAGLLTLLLVAWWSQIRPLKTEQYLISQRMKQLAKTQASAERVRAQHALLRQRLSAAQERENSLLARVPDDPSEEEFLALASGLASKSGLKIHDYRPGSSTTGPSCSTLEVQLIGEGAYASVCQFLDGISKLPRHATVAGLHIDAKGDKESYLVEISILLYFGATADPGLAAKEAPHA